MRVDSGGTDHGEPAQAVPSHGADDVGGPVGVGVDRFLARRDAEGRQHRVGTGHHRVDRGRVENVGADDIEPLMVRLEGFRPPGDSDDLMSGVERLPGEQPSGGSVRSENHDAHDVSPVRIPFAHQALRRTHL